MLHPNASPIQKEVKDVFIYGLKVELSGVAVLESPADDDDEDRDLSLGQGRLAQQAGEEKRYSMELFNHMSTIEKSLSSLEKRVEYERKINGCCGLCD